MAPNVLKNLFSILILTAMAVLAGAAGAQAACEIDPDTGLIKCEKKGGSSGGGTIHEAPDADLKRTLQELDTRLGDLESQIKGK